ncbi:unnamed protein product [Ranitomeya imitator]|uniref:ribonuclease H n=1 Tax=Ranitomeya imitator TaxID=111125 RepID=A0ABN9MCP3_9NEOB|nr:unnamed protein product [Ranitomeya imitator]
MTSGPEQLALESEVRELQQKNVLVKVPAGEEDLKDAYYHVPIHIDHQKFLRVAVSLAGTVEHFQYQALPFGVAVAPRVFTKIMVEVMAHLHEQDILIVPYLDDLLIVGHSESHCTDQLQKVMDALHKLGWMVNIKKSRLQPRKVQEFLGYVIDSSQQECRLPDTKVAKIKQLVTRAINNPLVSGRHVRLLSDNRVTVAYINRQGGTRSSTLMEVANPIFQVAEVHLLSLTALHIKGSINTKADYLSRNMLRQGEWSLNPAIFSQIIQLWGCPEIDLFANRENKKLHQFCSLNPKDNPYAVDALLISWHFRLAYAFPPLNLISLVLRKIREDKARGCDKQFFNSSVQFNNMDLLLDYINSDREFEMNVQYCTLSEYFTSLYNRNMTWKVRGSQDFLPYSSDIFQAWTGFFASRNVLKGIARRASSLLYAGESAFTQYLMKYPSGPVCKMWALAQLQALRWAVSEVQHHDGITGTESPKVGDMYMAHLHQGVTGVRKLMKAIVTDQFGYEKTETSKGLIHITVYNPVAWNVTTYISMALNTSVSEVYDELGQIVPAQTKYAFAGAVAEDQKRTSWNEDGRRRSGPETPIRPDQQRDRPWIQNASDPGHAFDLYILVVLPGLGYRQYSIKMENTEPGKGTMNVVRQGKFSRKLSDKPKNSIKRIMPVSNDCYTLWIDLDTNLLVSITDRERNDTVQITQEFLEYHANGDTGAGPISDNYMFYSNGNAVPASKSVGLEIVTGKLVSEVRQYFYRDVNQQNYTYAIVSRLYHVPDGYDNTLACRPIEQQYRVGPLERNREAIIRTQTNLQTNKRIYTDDNAFQMQAREFKIYDSNTVARNYYPMVRTAYIEDEKTRLVLLAERSHGVSSQDNGQMEIMLHRRLWNNVEWDLNYNLTLDDTSIVRPTIWLMVGSKEVTNSLYQRLGLYLEHKPLVMLSPSKGHRETENLMEADVPVTLPPNIHLQILSIPGWKYSSNHTEHMCTVHQANKRGDADFSRVLLRMQHLYEDDEDPVLSKSATINIKLLLQSLGTVKLVEERSLTGTWDLATMKRWKWKSTQQKDSDERMSAKSTEDFTVTVSPKEIRTFFVYFQ